MGIARMYRILGHFWQVENGLNIYKNPNCYKILTFDELDDVVDIFASIHHHVAQEHSKHDYKTADWKQFYESLALLFDLE